MREANIHSLPAPVTAALAARRHRSSELLAAILLDVVDLLCEESPDYEEFRNAVKPLLDGICHGKR